MFESYRFGVFTWPLAVSAAASAGLFIYLWQTRRENTAARFLAYLCGTVVIWASANIFEYAALTYRLKLLWSQISYLGILMNPVFYFLFSLAFVQKTRFITKTTLTVLSIIPMVTILLAFTNEYHKLIWTGIAFLPGSTMAVYGHGVLYYFLALGYSYVLLAAGFLVILVSSRHLPAFYRGQTLPFLVGLALPFAGNLIYITGLNPVPGLDWAPMVFTLTCFLITRGMFRYRIFDIVPVARSLLVETMSDGILVLNERNEILDLNPAMKVLLGDPGKTAGRPVREVFREWPEIFPHLESKEFGRPEVIRRFGDESLYFDVRITPVHHGPMFGNSRIFVFRDITRKKRLEMEKERLQEKLDRTSSKVRELEGLLPICAGCKKIRDDSGSWNDIETYVESHAEVEFTHSLCPDCLEKYSRKGG